MKFTKAISKFGRKVLRKIRGNQFVVTFVTILCVTAITSSILGMDDNVVVGEVKEDAIIVETTIPVSTTTTTTEIPQTTISEETTTNTTTTTTTTTTSETTTSTTTTSSTTTTTQVTTIIETTPPEPVPEYIVYKPSTHYVHRSTCHWVDSTCQEITSTEGYETRKCSECNPDIEIISPYVEPVIETPIVDTSTTGLPITEYERILLCNLVGREYGANWVPTAEKAKVVAVVMNRVRDPRFPNDIYSVLTQPYQFSGYLPSSSYTSKVTDDVIAAVNYYFNNTAEFSSTILYFEGDGTWNYFH